MSRRKFYIHADSTLSSVMCSVNAICNGHFMGKMQKSSTFLVLMPVLVIVLSCIPAVESSTTCSGCDGNNVTCDDGVCLFRCVRLRESGECLQCLDSRFYGKQCEHDCPHTCLNSRCQMNNTRVVCTEGCVAGKKGENCASLCPSSCTRCEQTGNACIGSCQNNQYYGSQCETPCPDNCLDGCWKDTGKCRSCIEGYRGEYCDRCVEGFRGMYCDVACSPNCLDSCDKDKGDCGSCVAGYTGTYCNETCPSNCTQCKQLSGQCIGSCPDSQYYGPFCSILCPVSCAGCDKTTGRCILCADGYTRCTDGLCQRGACQSGNTILTLKVTAGVLAVLVTLGTTLAVVIITRRKSKCQQIREPSPRSQDLGRSDGSEYWTHKYWEIHDKDIGSESDSSNLPVPQIPHRRPVQTKDIPLENVKVRSSVLRCDSAMSSAEHAALVHQSGHDSTHEPFLAEMPQVDVGDSDVADAAERDIKCLTVCKSDLQTYQAEDRAIDSPVLKHTEDLIRKTDSIIAIEQRLDLASVSVQYLTPDKVKTVSNTL
ncbi:multiple epidermal growth factor-like domains protein 10 [Haliotis asinina]|uniref:multiple epidermal growth factor-like domains protein 10 n=1 Tax=Haliotis asinina TaxID=109174 RepID=UPI003531BE7E